MRGILSKNTQDSESEVILPISFIHYYFFYCDTLSMAASAPVDPKILALRKEMAARYARVPEANRPKVRTCANCNLPVHASPICASTGLFHDLDSKRIIGGLAVDGDRRAFTGGELVAALNAARIKFQPARVSLVRVDADSIGVFQTFVAQTSWRVMRIGVLYGTVEAATPPSDASAPSGGGRTVTSPSPAPTGSVIVNVHSIYEPEQLANDSRVVDWGGSRDPRLPKVDALAGLLGLRRVGLIVTHPVRDSAEVVLTGQELMMIAREQSIWGDHCLLLTAGPDATTKQLHSQAWQASEQAVELFRLGIFSEHPENSSTISSSHPLELAQEDVDDKGKRTMLVKAAASVVDCRWLLGYIAVEQWTSPLLQNKFIRISRPGQRPPEYNNLRIFVEDPKRKRLPLVEQLQDFHVLVFLMENLFDIRSDMPVIVDAIRSKDSSRLGQLEEIIREGLRNPMPSGNGSR